MRILPALCCAILLGSSLAAEPPSPPAPPAAANQWAKVDEGRTGERTGSMLVWAPDLKQMLLVGGAKGASFVQAFDPAVKAWSELSAAAPVKEGINNYYQTAYDPGTRSVYCLSGGTVLYAFSAADKAWKALPAAAELEGLSWQALACDPAGKRLAVVGADKKAEGLGWMRAVVYDIPAGKYTDHGAIFFENGQRPLYVNSIAVDKEGAVYALSRITEGGHTRTDLFRVPPVLRK